MNYQERLLKAIPGGAHTYSRGFDQFPTNAPQILTGGKGAYVFDPAGKKILDYGMGLRSVNLGYAEDRIVQAAFKQMSLGNSLTRPSMIELEAAELLIELIDSVDMVKFTKNGSTATTAAIKLSRSYTGRALVARCMDHPFFSYDDWFIGSTDVKRGILPETISNTKTFRYNDIQSLEKLFDEYPGQIAGVILEPATTHAPENNFLQKVRDVCTKQGAVLIFDEMITGFRFHIEGAQKLFGVIPDLSTFGKAMANGFSVAAVAGKRDIMKIGSIEFAGTERMFFLSTTNGAEMCGLGAFVETMKYLREHDVIGHLWDYGTKLTTALNAAAKSAGLEKHFRTEGYPCSPYFNFYNDDGTPSLALKTIFNREMMKEGILLPPWFALSYSHREEELKLTKRGMDRGFDAVSKALKEGVEKHLRGESPIRPVFRKFN